MRLIKGLLKLITVGLKPRFAIYITIIFILINIGFSHLVFSQTSTNQTSTYTFSLPEAASTSAGVYKDSILVRNLWTNITYSSGSHQLSWDGKDDQGNTLPAGSYKIKVLSSNMAFTWKGAHVGNTSSTATGSSVHRVYGRVNSIHVIGSEAYYTSGYSERLPSVFSFGLSAPQAKVNIFPAGTTTPFSASLCDDGTNVYYTAFDPYNSTRSFIYATKISDKSRVSFSSGFNYTLNEGDVFNIIGYSDGETSAIGGIATGGNYLFYTHPQKDSIVVINKTTGAFVRTVGIAGATGLASDGAGSMWITSGTNTIQKYTINSNGTLTATGVSITGVTAPGAITVSDSGKVVVVDKITQKLLWFNNSDGMADASPTFGQTSNYTTNSIVANDKFAEITGISFAPDGSFWVVDAGNVRMQHFSSNRIFIETIQVQGPLYTTNVDNGDPTKVFGGYKQYSVDYSATLSGSSGWVYTNNWGYQIDNNLYGTYNGFSSVHTFTSGSVSRTFAFLRKLGHTTAFELVELQSNGSIRFTGILKDHYIIDDTGALLLGNGDINNGGYVYPVNKYTYTGAFDGSNNPVWSATPQVLVTVTPFSSNEQNNVLINGLGEPVRNFVTSDNKVISWFNNVKYFSSAGSVSSENYNHLGAVAIGGSTGGSWQWQNEKSTFIAYQGDYPPAGFFEIGNGVLNAGSCVMVSNNIIVTGYHGEFWKGSQTNKYNVYYSDGLSLGQFGTTGPEITEEAAYGMAGNALNPQLVRVGNRLFMWHGDESYHSGIHLWEITGENTINEQTINITYPNSLIATPVLSGIDLMAGLTTFGNTLADGLYGWNRSSVDVNTSNQTFSAFSGQMYFDKSDPDLAMTFRFSNANSTQTITRTLENTATLNSWSITGKLNWNLNYPNDIFDFGSGHCNGSFIDVLDNNGKIIARFFTQYTIGSPYYDQVIGNDKTMFNLPEPDARAIIYRTQPLSISLSGGKITFAYAGYSQATANVQEIGANMNRPATLRFYFFQAYGGIQNNVKYTSVQDLRFVKKINQTITFNPIASKYFGILPFALMANSSSLSNIPITYTIISGPAKISENVLTLTGAGTVIIEADQAGNDLYDAATPVTQSFIVKPMRVDL